MTIVRIWFSASAALLLLAFLYAYVPILLPFLAVTAALGAVSAGIVALTRRFVRRPDAPSSD